MRRIAELTPHDAFRPGTWVGVRSVAVYLNGKLQPHAVAAKSLSEGGREIGEVTRISGLGPHGFEFTREIGQVTILEGEIGDCGTMRISSDAPFPPTLAEVQERVAREAAEALVRPWTGEP